MRLRWSPPSERHEYRGLTPGDVVDGPRSAHPEHLWPWLVPVGEAPAPTAPAGGGALDEGETPANIDAGADAPAEAGDVSARLDNTHHARLYAAAVRLGHTGGRGKGETVPYLLTLDPGEVLAELEG